MRILLIGLPGAGKTTQGGRLAPHFHVPHISTGIMVRSLMRGDHPRGIAAANFVVSGRFTPDEIIVPMVRERLAEADCRPGFILDGFPRTRPQVLVFDEILEQAGLTLDVVVVLEVPPEVCSKRIADRRVSSSTGNLVPDGGAAADQAPRVDDTAAAVSKRFDDFYAESVQVIESYEKRGLVRRVNGDAAPEAVTETLLDLLASVRHR